MVRPIVDSRGNVISSEQVSERTNIIGARNYRGGLPDADANLSFIPTDRRGIAGLQGKFQEMLTTHVGIASAAYWAITEGAALPKEIVWPHRQEPDADADAFIAICQAAVIDEAIVFDGMLEGANALWSYPLLDAFMGFGLMLPRMVSGGAVEWYPIAHNAVMLWKPNGYLLGGVRFSTPNGYDDIDAADLVHTVHGLAGAGEFEGRSLLRDLVQPFELWKQIAINAGIYNQLSWGFLDIAYGKNVSDDDIAAFNTFGQQFQDGQRKYILRPENINVEMRYPSGSPPDVIAQLEYWDRQIEKKLNSPLAGISQFGSRAMAETLDDAAGRKAKAWLNSIFERSSRGMFQWLAQAVGYEGRLPRVQIQSAEMTTGIGGWSAYVAGVQAGLLTKGPDDESWGRRVIGAPELEAAPVVAEDAPAPLLVGSLQVAQTVLQSLKVSPVNPVPIAPEAAVLLLIAAGLNEAAARNMVAAQMTVPDAAAAPTPEASSVAAPPATVSEAPAATAPPAADTVGSPAPPSQPQVTVGGNIQVPAAIGEAAAFAPSKVALAESDVDLTPTAEMAANAERALAWRDEYGRGGTAVGVARARDLKNKRQLSADVVRRMASYFARHAVDKKAVGFNKGEDGFPSAGRIAFDLWGGAEGEEWAARKVAELNRNADMSEAVVRMSKTTTAAFVPADVRTAAEAALAAHASSTRRRTSDADALVTAQRLASGEPLEMARVAKLVSYFNAADAAERNTARFAMRGGAAAEAWTARLVAAWSRNEGRGRQSRTACDCGGCGDLADDDGGGDGFVVIGGDGKPFAAWRELRPEETVVGFATLAENRVEDDAALAAEIEAVAVQHREAVKRALRDGWQAGERDAVWLRFVEQYQAVLTKAAGRLRSMTDAEVMQEIQRAARGNIGGGVGAEQAAAATQVLAAQSNDAFARAAALTQKAGEVIADRVQGEVENAILGGADMALFASRITPAGLVRSAAESRNVVEHASRVSTYAKAPEAVGIVPTQVVRSSIPDGERCSVCADADTGERLNVADYVVGGALQLPPLPDPNCLGGVGRCRCGYFAIFKR